MKPIKGYNNGVWGAGMARGSYYPRVMNGPFGSEGRPLPSTYEMPTYRSYGRRRTSRKSRKSKCRKCCKSSCKCRRSRRKRSYGKRFYELTPGGMTTV